MITLQDVYQGAKIAPGAIEFLFELIKERMTEPEVNISATMPSPEQHRQFVHRRPYRYWYLIVDEGGQAVGYISATTRNEIGIVLAKEHRSKGIGTIALKEFLEKHDALPAVPTERRGRFVANINPANTRSVALFTNAGAKLIQHTYELPGKEGT